MIEPNDNTREPDAHQDVKTESLPAWHRPEMSKISVEMTLYHNGSPNDTSSGSTPTY